nr:hypothetical protein [Bacillota bacterium]
VKATDIRLYSKIRCFLPYTVSWICFDFPHKAFPVLILKIFTAEMDKRKKRNTGAEVELN